MKGIDKARAELDAAKAKGEDDKWFAQFQGVLEAGIKLKAVMVQKGITNARAKCPKCEKETLHGRLIIGQAAGRHRKSGGAFRMWCDTCPDIRMME
jgi:hypothetical protein